MRAARREPAAIDAMFAELDDARGANRDLDAFAAALRDVSWLADGDQARARQIAQSIALAFTASLLVRHAPAFVADAFCASRLRSAIAFAGAAFGTLPKECDAAAVIRRAGSS